MFVLAFILIENAPLSAEVISLTQRPMVKNVNKCFTGGKTGGFKVCSIDSDCKDVKSYGFFGYWEYPLCVVHKFGPKNVDKTLICCNESAL